MMGGGTETVQISDRCTSRLGRRRPFLIGGILGVIFSQILIVTSSDIGYALYVT